MGFSTPRAPLRARPVFGGRGGEQISSLLLGNNLSCPLKTSGFGTPGPGSQFTSCLTLDKPGNFSNHGFGVLFPSSPPYPPKKT